MTDQLCWCEKGDPALLDNCQGIVVGSVLGKLFSLVLRKRLDVWVERPGVLGSGQAALAGFRNGECTNNHVLVLRCQQSKRLHACDKFQEGLRQGPWPSESVKAESGRFGSTREYVQICVWSALLVHPCRAADLPSTDPLSVALLDNASMQYRPKQSCCVALESFRVPYWICPVPEGMQSCANWVTLPVTEVLLAFHKWCVEGLTEASHPHMSPSGAESLSTYEHWLPTDPVCMAAIDVPGYVANTACIANNAGIHAQHMSCISFPT